MADNNGFLEPPKALISNNPVGWFRYFGPGAIIASGTIGSGEVLFSSRSGSLFGYHILWVIVVVSFMKWVLSYSCMRHMILTGAHPFQRWSQIPGPRGWLPLFMIVIATVCYPIWYAFLSGVFGTMCQWIFGADTIPGNYDVQIWASIFIMVSIVITFLGNYSILEKVQMTMIATMLGFMFTSLFYLRPDWGEVFFGTVVPTPLSYPEWAFRVSPILKDRTPWVEIMMFCSAIGGASFDYLAYASFLRDKKWGRSHLGIAKEEDLAEAANQKDHPSRLWVRAAFIDSAVSFIVVAALSTCFAILGTLVLRPQELLPQGTDLMNHQAQFLTALSPWLEYFYKAAIFAAFLPMFYGGPDMAYRVYSEYLNTIGRFRGRLNEKGIKVFAVAWCLIGGMALLWVKAAYPDLSLIQFISPAGIYTGILSSGVYCLVNAWMDRRFLPKPLQMNGFMASVNVIAGIAFIYMGMKALWDLAPIKDVIGGWDLAMGGWAAYILLVIQLGIAVGVAQLTRRYFHPDVDK